MCMIVDFGLQPILGKKASEQMGFITINYNNFESVHAVNNMTSNIAVKYADVFDDSMIGNLPGQASLCLREGVQPVELPPRREPREEN